MGHSLRIQSLPKCRVKGGNLKDEYDAHCVESLAFHLERAQSHANELGLTRVVARLGRLRAIAPEVSDRVPEPAPVVPVGPRTIDHPLDRRSIEERVRLEQMT